MKAARPGGACSAFIASTITVWCRGESKAVLEKPVGDRVRHAHLLQRLAIPPRELRRRQCVDDALGLFEASHTARNLQHNRPGHHGCGARTLNVPCGIRAKVLMKDLEIAKDTVDLRAGRDCRARLPGRRSLRQRDYIHGQLVELGFTQPS